MSYNSPPLTSWYWYSLLTGLLLCCMLVRVDSVSAQAGNPWNTPETDQLITDPQQATQQAFQSNWGFNWYDGAKDDTRAVNLPPDKAQPTQPAAPPAPPVVNNTPTSSEEFGWLGWFILIVIMVIVILLVLRVFLQNEDPVVIQRQKRVEYVTSSAKLEDLPFDVKPVVTDFFTEARRLALLGELKTAMNYFYSHVLIHLAQANLIQLARGKTNRQYLLQLKSRADLYAYFEQLMITFEASYFGDHPPTLERFQALADAWPNWSSRLSELGGFATERGHI